MQLTTFQEKAKTVLSHPPNKKADHTQSVGVDAEQLELSYEAGDKTNLEYTLLGSVSAEYVHCLLPSNSTAM